MNFKPGLFSIVLAPFGALFAHTVNAAQNAPVPFSKYGQIQAVQNYSSNPFWSKDSPYNQKMPTPVYAMGPDLNTGDCQRIVDSLVASQCAANNNCVGMKIADIRPNIIVGLSQLPGHSFATSCAGYIDSSFNNYVKKYGYVKPSVGAAFPTAYAPNPNASGTANTDTTVNLFQPKPTSYQSGVLERTRELAELHASTSNGSPVLATTAFPTTIADLSMSQRMELKSDGYEPYKDSVVYHPITIQSEEDYQKELKAQNMSVYCARYPDGEDCKQYNSNFTKAKTDAQQAIVEANTLLAKNASKLKPNEKQAIEKARDELQNTLDSATTATTTTINKLTEQTGILNALLQPLKPKESSGGGGSGGGDENSGGEEDGGGGSGGGDGSEDNPADDVA